MMKICPIIVCVCVCVCVCVVCMPVPSTYREQLWARIVANTFAQLVALYSLRGRTRKFVICKKTMPRMYVGGAFVSIREYKRGSGEHNYNLGELRNSCDLVQCVIVIDQREL